MRRAAVAQVVKTPDGRKLSVEVTGHPTGEPVFLLHGTPGSLLGPRPRGIFLYRLGIRLISYNRPGYPGSDRVNNRIVADAAADVDAIARHFGLDRFSVIGRSGGAPHALACAADERLRDRLICTAALSSLAPYDAEDLDWFADMAESNVEAYHNAAESDLQALVATFKQTARQVRNNSQGLLNTLRPELVDSDKQVMGDIALRRIIARTHAEALRESVHGWIDDVIALARPWYVDFSGITRPVLLWHGDEDVFSPAGHTRWLNKKIDGSELRLPTGAAHFEAITILPEILGWVLETVNEVTPVTVPAVARSEGLRIDHAEQSTVDAGLGHLRMLSPEHVG
jgi:pimeloyl-ACP methyl ester carboxylesterase